MALGGRRIQKSVNSSQIKRGVDRDGVGWHSMRPYGYMVLARTTHGCRSSPESKTANLFLLVYIPSKSL